MIDWWQFSLLSNILVALACFAVSLLIFIPAYRLHLTRSKKLATAMAALFFAVAVGRAMVVVHYLVPGANREEASVTFWWEGAWNLVIAAAAIYLLSLYRYLGQLLVGSVPFDNMIQRRETDELAVLRSESAGRIAAEAERDASASMLRSIVANNQAAIYVKDLSGRYLLGNPMHAKIVGRPEADFLGLTDAVVDPVLAEVWQANDARARMGRLEIEEWNDQFPDGRHFYESVKFPLYDQAGQVYAVCGSSLDVTEGKRATVAVEEALEAAVAASAAKSTFLATMSHEIRTPMNAVIGMTDLLLGTDLDEQQFEFVDTVRFSGDALLAVINDILDFSKIESGEMRMEQEPFLLRDAVESCLDLVVAAATSKGLDLVCYVEESCPTVVIGDANRLRQIIVNLLSNAVKFTAAGEILITVSSEPTSDGVVPLTIKVTDTGIGIAPAGVLRLFQSFTQVDDSTTRVYGGTGLGLAISQRLTQAMGGDVLVESVPEVGSTFTVTLTLKEGVDVPTTAAPGADLEGLSVLLVDDNLTCLRIMDLQLSSLGMHCTTVATPANALKLVKEGYSYDVAIVDMLMPLMNGVELAAALRALPSVSESPIVLVTSVGSRPAGAADVFSSLLAKPVKGAALRRALSTALGRRLSEDDADRTGTAVRAARPLSILLAEDNAVNQRVAQLMLDMLGHQVHTVDNGLAAVEAAQDANYDVILMDVQMPQLDGLDATRRILQQASPDRRPHIIAMTASALAQDRDACTEAGMEGYLMKPVRANDLRAALAEVTRPDAAPATPTDGSPTASKADDALECTPAIDEAVLEQLMEQLDDESGDLLRELIDSYLSDSTPDVAGFVAAADADDATAVLRIAHSLRSTSGLLGAKVMVGLLIDTEDAARADSPDLGPMARAVQQEFGRVSSRLREGRRQPALTRAE